MANILLQIILLGVQETPISTKNKKIKHLTHFYKKQREKQREREKERKRDRERDRERKSDNRINFQKTIGCESIGIKHNR